MPAPALVRDSFFGQFVYHTSGYRFFRHADELPESSISSRFAEPFDQKLSATSSRTATIAEEPREDKRPSLREEDSDDRRQLETVVEDDAESGRTKCDKTNVDIEKGEVAASEKIEVERTPSNSRLVDWYGPEDSDNPMNWSLAKKCFVTFEICLLTFSIYIGSAIYSPGIGEISEQFGVSSVAATLGLTLFVVGYGIGPMFLSPLSEIPQIGRTNIYILTLFTFVILQIPTALSKNLGALLPLRFLAGFVGSPALATGGASLGDIWALEYRSVSVGIWSLAAVCGPVLGPVVGGFVTQGKDWTWTIWILCWLSGMTVIFLTFFLPETYAETILYRRAARLRRITGNPMLKSKGEIDVENMSAADVIHMNLIRPFIMSFVEPIVIFWNLYIALVYGILYIFIESFRVVFVEHHGFNLGENGLTFLGLFLGAVIAYLIYLPWGAKVLAPKLRTGSFVPEDRLPIAMVGAILLPISMFWFGWTSSASVHWIVPIIASVFFSAGTYLLFQAGLNYLPDCYPNHVASVLAGNDFFRSMVGAAFPLFSTAFFHNLGVGPACSILGGIALLMLPIPFILHRYGARIRARSRYTN